MHIKIIDGASHPYSISQLRRENAQVSFPETPSAPMLAAYNVYAVSPVDAPTPGAGEVVEPADPAQQADGSWAQAWRVRPKTADELAQDAAHRIDERNAAYRREADPLFFKAQRGESTMQEWLDKVAEIKTRIPE